MPYSKVRIHLDWCTKNRTPCLIKDIRLKLFEHIQHNARVKRIDLHCINGYDEHIHLLITLQPEQTIAKVVQLIKGESSFWINKNALTKNHFEWQDEYFAISVSESSLESLVHYIDNQESHHEKKKFSEEYNEIINKFGFGPEARSEG